MFLRLWTYDGVVSFFMFRTMFLKVSFTRENVRKKIHLSTPTVFPIFFQRTFIRILFNAQLFFSYSLLVLKIIKSFLFYNPLRSRWISEFCRGFITFTVSILFQIIIIIQFLNSGNTEKWSTWHKSEYYARHVFLNFLSVIFHKRNAPIIPEREIKNEEGRQQKIG